MVYIYYLLFIIYYYLLLLLLLLLLRYIYIYFNDIINYLHFSAHNASA